MKTTHTFIVHFWLKKKSVKKDGTIPIYARIRLDGNSADISTKESTLESNWCPMAERINNKVKDANLVNNVLDDMLSGLKTAYRTLLQEGGFITVQAVKQRFLGEDSPLATLNDLFKYHRKNELIKLKNGTAKNYSATEKYLQRFIKTKYKTTDVNLGQINYAFVLSFENYLRTCKPLLKSKPLGNNGIMKHMERFKKMTTIVDRAVKVSHLGRMKVSIANQLLKIDSIEV